MGLITRFYGPNAKGSKLTIKEMDDNLYYLQSFGVTGVTYSSNILTLTNPTGGTLSVNIENDVNGNMWFIPSGETVTIPSNIQNFIYGDLVVEGSLILEADSQLVVLNGNIILSGGTLTGDGTTYIIDLPETDLHVTSGSFNPTTKQITFTGNIGFTPFDVDLSSLSTDNFYLTAGTYNSLTESIDFSGNDPVTNFSVDVSQLLDDTNTYTTGATLNGSIVEFNRNDISNAYSVDLSPLEFSGAVTDGATITGDGTPGNPLVAPFQSPSADGVTITGDGTVGNPLVATFQSPSADGVTITGDGTPGNPLVSVFQSPYVDGVTITGDGTPGDPLVAAGGAVNYGNVFFVDAVNGNNTTALRNDFTKPYLTINQAIDHAGQGVLYPAPTATDRALVYVRRGTYTNNIARLLNYVDIYCEPGVVFVNAVVHDQGASVICNFYGKAKFTGNVQSFSNTLFRLTGTASKVYFEFDDLFADRGAFEVNNGASATISGRKVFSETFNTGFGGTFRGAGTVVVNITEEFAAWHDPISFVAFSGKFYMTCPRIYLHEGNYYGGDYKHVVICRNNLGGEATINGDLIVNSLAGYYGGISGVIGRWTDSFMTLRINGNLFCENQFGVYGLGSSAASRTIINGDVRTNNLVCYVASNSNVVFRNGTLMNWNTTSGSEGYPVMSVGGSGKIWVENCHIHSLGLGATYPNVSAFWKDTTTSEINVYNSVYSAADTPGFFIRNSAGGQPINNVRILNCRSTKPLDTNITDILTPTGFMQDNNILSINFI